VLTNAHVVNECKELTVASPRGAATPARIVANDKQNDLAVLQSTARPAAIATLRGARPVRPGETVVAYGFPLTGDLSSGGVLTSGSVSALSGYRDDTRFFQMSTQIQPGNSGGPLLDTTGAVVGVTTSGLDRSRTSNSVPQNVIFALKVGVIRTFLESAGISAETSPGGRELSLPDIGEKARAFTVLVECRN
jgi:S1-C subfamily serine protease